MMTPEQRMKRALKHAIRTIAEYLEPGDRDAEKTLDELIGILDNNEVASAIEESDIEERLQAAQKSGHAVEWDPSKGV
jgi:hypothetical protein